MDKMQMLLFGTAALTLLVLVAGWRIRQKRRRLRWSREWFIREYAFPPHLDDSLRREYPMLTREQLPLVHRAMRSYFACWLQAGFRPVAMPSRLVDAYWHAFILDTRAYAAFWTENSLGKRAFPSLAKLENDVVDFGLSLMNAPEDAAGTFTSGGSESIFLAVQTARDWARATKGIDKPNFVVPRTSHPAFTRAGHALGVEIRRVPTTRNDFKADIGAMAGRIDDNTVGLVGVVPELRPETANNLYVFALPD